MSELRPSLLVVDDDEAIALVTAQSLEDRYDCSTTCSATEAVELLKQRSYNVVLADLSMPQMSGLELCRIITECFRETVVVVVSAMSNIHNVIQALRQGAFDYLTKPFDSDDLIRAVERAVTHQAAVSAERRYEALLEEQVRLRTIELSATNQKLGSVVDALYGTYRSALRGLARTLETRDLETRGHSDRVVAYSLRLGEELSLGKSELIGLEQGALLHDIGKVGVRDSVLRKPGALTPSEWLLMREHVTHGVRIVEQIEFLQDAVFVVGQHHEKYDGSGYPRRLAGEDIHMNARIFAVADAYDAITSNRPYRDGRQYREAVGEIVKHSGTQFDPMVVDAFLGVDEGEWTKIRGSVSEQHDSSPRATRQDIESFVLSLNCPADMTGRLASLLA